MFQIPIVPVGTKPQRTPLHVEPSDPKQTLYIRNLNEQIDLEQMKLAIQSLFNPLDVKVKRNVRVRGQAFVSFASVELAKRAMELNGYLLFEKPIDIQWARQDSDTISKAKGTLETIKAARSKVQKQPLPKRKKRLTLADHLPPNSLLFVQNMPPNTAEQQIVAMFRQFPGFKEVRMVPGQNDIAFVEYESELSAGVAKQTLHGYRLLPNLEMKVSYARKG